MNSAEIDAIFQAISLIVKHNISNSVIITDSLNAVNSFSKPEVFAEQIIHVCIELANRMISPPAIVWIPGHVGVHEHDTADMLAKDALALPTINRVVFPNLKDVTDQLIKHHNDLGLLWTKRAETGRAYKELFPYGKDKGEKLIPRKKDVTITRLRLHNCRLNKYLHKIGLHDTGLCDVFGRDGSVEHFLLDCDSHKELSRQLSQLASSKKLKLSLKLVLSDESFLNQIYRYICKYNIVI